MAKQLTKKRIKEFFNHIRSEHPLSRPVTIDLTLHPGYIVRDGVELMGTVMREEGGDHIYMYINTDQVPLLTLKTLAHEYRHIMQWINMGWSGAGIPKQEKERDAQRWAGPIAREYLYGGRV